jgi:REP element-mobilizing transposase RayT
MEEERPLAYFLTWRMYGTWLPGDKRGTVRRTQNQYGTDRVGPRPELERVSQARMTAPAMILNDRLREEVARAIEGECAHRRWILHALSVRTNHVHLLVSSGDPPERVMNVLKSWATRRLREAGMVTANQRMWARHGSTRHIFVQSAFDEVWNYIVYGQEKEEQPD